MKIYTLIHIKLTMKKDLNRTGTRTESNRTGNSPEQTEEKAEDWIYIYA